MEDANFATTTSPSKKMRHNHGFDTSEHDLIIQIGEIWNNRYRIVRCLGKGSFGQVVEAFDMVDNENVAVKVIKNRKAFHHQALVEVRILQFLKHADAADSQNIVRLKRFFEFRNHLCLVCELLSLNLYELLRKSEFVGFSMELVRKIASQILITLAFLSRKEIQIIVCFRSQHLSHTFASIVT